MLLFVTIRLFIFNNDMKNTKVVEKFIFDDSSQFIRINVINSSWDWEGMSQE